MPSSFDERLLGRASAKGGNGSKRRIQTGQVLCSPRGLIQRTDQFDTVSELKLSHTLHALLQNPMQGKCDYFKAEPKPCWCRTRECIR
jgi:hypothetical protein